MTRMLVQSRPQTSTQMLLTKETLSGPHHQSQRGGRCDAPENHLTTFVSILSGQCLGRLPFCV
jgi:hypothetical protein